MSGSDRTVVSKAVAVVLEWSLSYSQEMEVIFCIVVIDEALTYRYRGLLMRFSHKIDCD